ncbi:MAG: hypothetical protein J7599_23170 [Niabella sp.]|nr:hypothetical protein [Niabella sp.]
MTDELEEGGFNNRLQPTETVADIAPNRTLIAGLLTDQAPLKPVAMYGLQNLEMVFAHYQPEITVALENKEGGQVQETLRFRKLGDFEPDQIGRESKWLRHCRFQAAAYMNAARMLTSNTALRQVLASGEKRSDMHAAIKKMIAILEQHL